MSAVFEYSRIIRTSLTVPTARYSAETNVCVTPWDAERVSHCHSQYSQDDDPRTETRLP